MVPSLMVEDFSSLGICRNAREQLVILLLEGKLPKN